MRQTTKRLALIGCLVSTIAAPAGAFDGSRKGFVLGGSAGLSLTRLSFSGPRYEDRSESFAGFGADFKIGGAFSDQVALYYTGRGALFGRDSTTWLHLVGLAGVSYYFKPTAPSWYLVGSIGPWDLLDVNSFVTANESSALGVSAGVGHEFAPHWGIEVTFNIGARNEGLAASSFVAALSYTLY
jgi:hypothetical protein